MKLLTHPTGRLCRSDLNWIRALTRVPTSSEYPNYHPGISNHRFWEVRWNHCCADNSTPAKTFFDASMIFEYLVTIASMPIYLKEPAQFTQSEIDSADVSEEEPSFCKMKKPGARFCNALVTYLIYTCNTSVLQACIKYVTICHNRYTLITYLSKPRPCICLDSSHKNSLTSYDVVVSQIKI